MRMFWRWAQHELHEQGRPSVYEGDRLIPLARSDEAEDRSRFHIKIRP